MALRTPPEPGTHRVRHARAADLRRIGAIEDAGGPMFAAAFAATLQPDDALLAPARRGVDRVDAPGFLLVVGPLGEPGGFSHVELVDGFAHLAQLSVLPDLMRHGIGTALVRASMREARAFGHDRLSLTTYRDLSWNGPFYSALGFVEVARPEPFERRLRDHERALGLDRHGPRAVMEVSV